MRRTAVSLCLAMPLLLVNVGCDFFFLAEKRIPTNERGVKERLREIQVVQQKYAAAHPGKGFACELKDLLPFEKYSQEEWRGRDSYYLQGVYAGFKFRFENCRAEKDGTVAHYQFVAEPYTPGESGTHVFCTDESGTLWFDGKWNRWRPDRNGSVAACLLNRKPYSVGDL